LNKKGFSLIEVVVALGIFAVVFAGTVTLVARVVSLELSARDRTTGIALAQGKMEETIANFDSSCPNGSIQTASNLPFTNNPKFRYTIINSNISYSSGVGPYISSPDFTEATVTVTWNNNLGSNSFSLKRILNKCQ
jgi:prepilin-type N-terminal cleavage/methylation domain-containing protein